jgi:hypothetical protein
MLHKIPYLAARLDMVAQACPALFYRRVQYIANRRNEALGPLANHITSLSARGNSGLKQRFAYINIAQTSY